MLGWTPGLPSLERMAAENQHCRFPIGFAGTELTTEQHQGLDG